jgi:hypothetical protein
VEPCLHGGLLLARATCVSRKQQGLWLEEKSPRVNTGQNGDAPNIWAGSAARQVARQRAGSEAEHGEVSLNPTQTHSKFSTDFEVQWGRRDDSRVV